MSLIEQFVLGWAVCLLFSFFKTTLCFFWNVLSSEYFICLYLHSKLIRIDCFPFFLTFSHSIHALFNIQLVAKIFIQWVSLSSNKEGRKQVSNQGLFHIYALQIDTLLAAPFSFFKQGLWHFYIRNGICLEMFSYRTEISQIEKYFMTSIKYVQLITVKLSAVVKIKSEWCNVISLQKFITRMTITYLFIISIQLVVDKMINHTFRF